MMENDRFSPPTTILPHRLQHPWGTPSSSTSPIPHPQPSLPVSNGRDPERRDLVRVQLHEGEGGGANHGGRVFQSASSARHGGSPFTLLYRLPPCSRLPIQKFDWRFPLLSSDAGLRSRVCFSFCFFATRAPFDRRPRHSSSHGQQVPMPAVSREVPNF